MGLPLHRIPMQFAPSFTFNVPLEALMSDVLYLGGGLIGFAICFAYVALCERI